MDGIDIVQIYNDIQSMYNTTKDIVGNFYSVLGIILALIAGASIYISKIWIKKAIEQEMKKEIAGLLEAVSKPEYVYGKEVLEGTKLINNQYEFPVLDNVSFKPDLWNRIILQPIKGNKRLEYECKIDRGRMKIKFENFSYEEDIGVIWTVFYYPDMVKYLDTR